MAYYDYNDLVTLDVTLPQDEASIVLYLRDPNGTVTSYGVDDLTRLSEGVYTYNQKVTVSGRWFYRFEIDGAIVGAEERSFVVKESVFHE